MKYSLFILIAFIVGCDTSPTNKQKSLKENPEIKELGNNQQQTYNILWLSAEDLSPRLAAYGDSTIATPNIDRLAQEGIVFEQVYCTAGVCAPSRNAIITGRYQTSNGGHNMRTLYNTFPEKTGLPKEYKSVPPAEVRCFPEYIRAKGYYTTNNYKTDYQFVAPPTVWDDNGKTASWRNRPNGKPFFSVINFTTTHESQLWKKADNPMRADTQKVAVPPYYPDDPIVRNDIARQYSNLSELDDQIGEVLAQLEADSLLDRTIIFFWTDHGDGLPFYKREIYRRGLHIPLIVRFPDKKWAGERRDELISAIDFGPTVLSLLEIETPPQMHGTPFLGKYAEHTKRKFVFAARDRIDSEYDRVRSVMDGQYQYVRNFYPQKPLYMDIDFRKNIPTMNLLLKKKGEGSLNDNQSFWFKKTKPKEELYDWKKDPFQLHNLADDPRYFNQLKEFRKQLDNWMMETNDLGGIPEKELLGQMWNENDKQPKTSPPIFHRSGNTIRLTSVTTGASIGYRLKGDDTWKVYRHKLALPFGEYEAIAMRIGYLPSNIIAFEK